MRTIKFRGQAKAEKFNIKKGSWIYGDLHTVDEYTAIDNGQIVIKVVTETVGQFIERNDKNKKEIYDGDILKDEYLNTVEVFWDGTGWGLRDTEKKDYFGCPEMYDFKKFHFEKARVIGNRWDTPELIE